MRTGIIRYPGSNCDLDALKYFENSFFIWHKETVLPDDLDLLVIPGGFEDYTILLTEECKKYKVPVVGGNVSLYNCTNDKSIPPTPIIMMVGIGN